MWKSEEFYNTITYHGIHEPARTWIRIDGIKFKWSDIGSTRPQKGRELANSELSNALQKKTEFTQYEWKQFGVENLSMTDFIEVKDTSGTRYFRPAYTDVAKIIHKLEYDSNYVRGNFKGLNWIDIGNTKPQGRELTNSKLSKALQEKTKFTQFTQYEWKQFGVENLSMTDFIEVKDTSGTRYFRPAYTDVYDSNYVRGNFKGLNWIDIGNTKPQKGRELANSKLSKALQEKTKFTQFTQYEWKQFGVENLSMTDFIEVKDTSGTRYFQPVELNNNLLLTDLNIKLPVELEELDPGEMVTLLTPWYKLQRNQTYAKLMLANPVIKVKDKEFRYMVEPYEDDEHENDGKKMEMSNDFVQQIGFKIS
jgi:hypothetical protein